MNAKRPGLDDSCKGRLLSPRFHSALTTLQIFTGVYRVFSGKSECRDFRIAGFTCMYYVCIQHKYCRCAIYGFLGKTISPKSVCYTVQIMWVSRIKFTGETLCCIDFPTISINFIRIGGDFPVNSKVITCNAYLFFFHAISTCVPKAKIMGVSDNVQSPSQLHAHYRVPLATRGFPTLFMGKTFAVKV